MQLFMLRIILWWLECKMPPQTDVFEHFAQLEGMFGKVLGPLRLVT